MRGDLWIESWGRSLLRDVASELKYIIHKIRANFRGKQRQYSTRAAAVSCVHPQGTVDGRSRHAAAERGAARSITNLSLMLWQLLKISLSNVDVAGVNCLLDVLGGLSIDSAANRHSGAEDLLHGTGESRSHGLGGHLLCDFHDDFH